MRVQALQEFTPPGEGRSRRKGEIWLVPDALCVKWIERGWVKLYGEGAPPETKDDDEPPEKKGQPDEPEPDEEGPR